LNTLSEENYLKAILKATEGESHSVSTNTLAEILCHKPPTVTDMIQRLSAKKLISYEKYKGVSITETGRSVALKVIRKHRLWEVFLVEKLGMGWHEVHDIAEQLEHVQSDFLTERLNQYLQFPQFDPHGDPIPDESGKMPEFNPFRLSEAALDEPFVFAGISDHNPHFLAYIDKLGLKLGQKLRLLSVESYDQSCLVQIGQHQTPITLSFRVASNLLCNKL
jgi:DtxR family Mn-dependent transcriptional regulator